MTKVCTRCKKIKAADDGYRMCQKCRERARADYYRNRREREMARGDWMAALKATMSCTDCGISHPEQPHRMHWDHLPGTDKKGNISDMVFDGKTEEVFEEIKKCELVCARCHHRRGRERGQIPSPQKLARTLQCDHCGAFFERRPSQIHTRNYCSNTCSGLARRKLKIHHWAPSDAPKPPKQYSERTIHRARLLGLPLPNGEPA